MTIHSRRLVRQELQRTQATLYNEQLANARDREAQFKKPRSQGAWSSEQNRLGSWRTGLGRFTITGRSSGFVVGAADPLYSTEPEEDDRGSGH